MLRATLLVVSLMLASGALAHSESKWIKGPQGGHIVDAGGGKQHWELVANGNELTLYILDASEKPVQVDSGTAKGQVLLKGKTFNVGFMPAGGTASIKPAARYNRTPAALIVIAVDRIRRERRRNPSPRCRSR